MRTLVLALAIALASTASADELTWKRNHRSAHSAANKRNANKSLLLVYTPKGYTDALSKRFREERSLAGLGAELVGGAIKFREGDEDATRYGVSEAPCVVFVGRFGQVRGRWIGAAECQPSAIGREVYAALKENAKTQFEEREARRIAKAVAEREAAEAQAWKEAYAAAIESRRAAYEAARKAGAPLQLSATELAAAAGKEREREWYLRRQERVAFLGAPDPTEVDALQAALTWLARHQAPDGRWWADGKACPDESGCPADSREGIVLFDPGVSALALLALFAGGHTTSQGHHPQVVALGLRYLLSLQKPDGSIGYTTPTTIYNHAIATLALSEAYNASGDPALREPLERAVEFCVKAQNPNLGWKYGIKSGRNDSSVTAWMLQALSAAQRAGVDVPEEAFAGGLRWFDRATDSAGTVGYESPGGGGSVLPQEKDRPDLPAMTAASVLCQLLAGERVSKDDVRKGRKIVWQSPPSWGSRGDSVNYYYWYLGAQALAAFGKPTGETALWRSALVKTLLAEQETAGCRAGSWPTAGPWCLGGGRVYATAMGALSLAAPYRIDVAEPPTEVQRARDARAKGAQ